MKEKYEKPSIESETFSLEMMQADCTISKKTAYLGGNPYYGSYKICQGECSHTTWTNS